MTATMEIIRSKYPGRLALSPKELGSLLHKTPHYICKAVRAGVFPIPWMRIGNKIMFPVSAVVAALDSGAPPPTPRRRGRPTKAEQMRRAGNEG